MIVHDMPDEVYHARPELSSTGARKLIDSPARYRYWADNPQPPKASFDVGHASHRKVLGVGANIIVYPDEHLTPSGNVSTKAETRVWEAEARKAGLTPIGQADADRVDAMAEAVLADPTARTILENIRGREVSVFTVVDGVPVRARFDVYGDHRGADLKTTRDASPRGFNRAVGSYGYDVQERFYSEAHFAETGQILQSFKFIAVETAPPHLVGVYDLDLMWQEVAEVKLRRARDLYKQCTETGVWPSYGENTLTAPTWAVFEGEETEINI